MYISGKDDPGKMRVTAASPTHIFAMKALAARTRDIDDIRLLAGMIGVASVEAALQVCRDFFPDEALSPRAAAVLEELFGLRKGTWLRRPPGRTEMLTQRNPAGKRRAYVRAVGGLGVPVAVEADLPGKLEEIAGQGTELAVRRLGLSAAHLRGEYG
ncbi:MAG TPA: hypothetical protein VMG38_14240, partial [Trebonia sp.]|nr:hypothetical protein [Trebonia sp.]